MTSQIKCLLKKIQSRTYISFDIFDTLIVRDVSSPYDIFNKVAKDLFMLKSSTKFPSLRICAEKKAIVAHKKKKRDVSEEISLESIYNEIDLPNEEKEIFKLKELECELNACHCNSEMKDVLELSRRLGKKIIISSDMYLPKNVICQILERNEIEYDFLYLSSDRGVRKSSGNLFRLEKKEIGFSKKQYIHIGDNWISDYLVPIFSGFKAHLYKKKENL